MTVKELIEVLKDCPQDNEVMLHHSRCAHRIRTGVMSVVKDELSSAIPGPTGETVIWQLN